MTGTPVWVLRVRMGFVSSDLDYWPVPLQLVARPLGMEPDDPMARVRERRFRALVDELLPQVRRFNPTMPDDQVLELEESMAELRLSDEEMG